MDSTRYQYKCTCQFFSCYIRISSTLMDMALKLDLISASLDRLIEYKIHFFSCLIVFCYMINKLVSLLQAHTLIEGNISLGNKIKDLGRYISEVGRKGSHKVISPDPCSRQDQP